MFLGRALVCNNHLHRYWLSPEQMATQRQNKLLRAGMQIIPSALRWQPLPCHPRGPACATGHRFVDQYAAAIHFERPFCHSCPVLRFCAPLLHRVGRPWGDLGHMPHHTSCGEQTAAMLPGRAPLWEPRRARWYADRAGADGSGAKVILKSSEDC